MLLVSVKRLKPGMVTALPVLHPMRSATRLVQADYALDPEVIGRLAELGVPHLWVKHPLLQDLDKVILSKVPEHRRKIYDTIKQGFDELQYRVITTNDYQHYRNVIGDLVTELIGRNARAGDLAERLFNDGDELSSHCANVAYLAVNIGMHLESYIARQRGRVSSAEARDLTSLGVGAMLHDIGKLQCTAEARQQHEVTSNLDDDYASHVLEGFEMLRHHINPVASAVALHHHQRWDGAGWPDMTKLTHGRHAGGLDGLKIHIFARIVAVANTFDNLMTGPGGQRPAIFALHAIQAERFAGAMDPIALNALLRYVPPFPVGAEVILSDGQPAAVVGINPDQPCRPTVRPLVESAQTRDIDLVEEPKLFIRESQGLDVTRWLYELPSKAEMARTASAVETGS